MGNHKNYPIFEKLRRRGPFPEGTNKMTKIVQITRKSRKNDNAADIFEITPQKFASWVI